MCKSMRSWVALQLFILLAALYVNPAVATAMHAITPFHSGDEVEISWECSGASDTVRLTLCKGGPCSYNGGPSDPHYLVNIGGYHWCDDNEGVGHTTWHSSHGLESGGDYHICVQDYYESSVRDCAQTSISAGEIAVTAIDPFFAGDSVTLIWVCNGPQTVYVTLCKGGPCSWNGGASNPHFFSNIASHSCEYNGDVMWYSSHTLESGDDYHICMEDSEASSVRDCTQISITARVITVSAIDPFHAGDSVAVTWACHGTATVYVNLCKGGPCIWDSSDPHYLSNILSYDGYCDIRAGLTWSSEHSLESGHDYHFCVQDTESSSVRGCAQANISAGVIAVGAIDPFHAGDSVALTWVCTGPERVHVALCKGGPCSWSGGASDPHYLLDISGHEYCDHRAGLTWSSKHSLDSGDDYHICLEDTEASSVRGCAQISISAGVIAVGAIDPFHAGNSMAVTWACAGPETVYVTLCKGGPCSWNGGASDPHYLLNINGNGYCDHRAGLTWPSLHSLESGDDYHVCVEDREASSVRGCSVVDISAGQIAVTLVAFSPQSVELSWVCTGPDTVYVTLCHGGPCSASGVGDPQYVHTMDSYEYCDHRAGLVWQSDAWSISLNESHYFCVEDREATSVRGCVSRSSTTTTTGTGAAGACAATSMQMYDATIATPELPSGGETTVACPIGYVGKIHLRCVDGVIDIVHSFSTCRAGCPTTTTTTASGTVRRLALDSLLLPGALLSLHSCGNMDHGNSIIVPCPIGYGGVATISCYDGVLQSDALVACAELGSSSSSASTPTISPALTTSAYATATSEQSGSTTGSQTGQTTTAPPSVHTTATATNSDPGQTQSQTTGGSVTGSQFGQTTATATTSNSGQTQSRSTGGSNSGQTQSQTTGGSGTGSQSAQTTATPSTRTTGPTTNSFAPPGGNTEAPSSSAPPAADADDADSGSDNMLYIVVAACFTCTAACCCVCVWMVVRILHSRRTWPEPVVSNSADPTPIKVDNWIAEKLPAEESQGLPAYWSGLKPPQQGWLLRPPDTTTCCALARMLYVADPSQLGVGQDSHDYHREYNRLEFYAAWRVEHPAMWRRFVAERGLMAAKMDLLSKQGCLKKPAVPMLPTLPGAKDMPGEREQKVNEVFLLSGVKPENLLAIIDQGLNIKVSRLQGMLGAGVYFAEDAAKMDQYTRPDSSFEQEGLQELHSRLFRAGQGLRHPHEDLFYTLVVRVALGWSARTKDGKVCVYGV